MAVRFLAVARPAEGKLAMRAERRGSRVDECRIARLQLSVQSVTAPTLLLETSFAYLARTPEV
jgi:hypothetical protein